MLYAPEEPEADTIRVPVVRVFDGDGFLTRIRKVPGNSEIEATVRFGFTDAPELEQPGGYEARDFLSRLIEGQWLDLTILLKTNTSQIVDAYGRIVAVPYLRQERPADPAPASMISRLMRPTRKQSYFSRNIELEMVLNGWTWVLDRYCPDERYFEALEDAQRHRRGIWAADNNIHPWEFKKQRHVNRRRRQGRTASAPTPVSSASVGASCPSEGCDGRLVPRSGKFGEFYGCSRFPKCRFSRSAVP
ncbi:topoisomerase DNA-binding C4 zinc finger domain-containing protein [Sphingomonas hankyongi]|uniref:Topoisomerase DNA-binding C4 zinc finger domain-containing protein n=1 Tax=Sphingomonas hankyongi TaxID=2908209 RepID=A0ABT0S018_9SPHN|nr:topoisomerase DNA-binding C4 zinc finger domain-containing protein [Sphingomonas hankyongi]